MFTAGFQVLQRRQERSISIGILGISGLLATFQCVSPPPIAAADTVGCSIEIEAVPRRGHPETSSATFVESEHFVVSYYSSGPDSLYRSDLPESVLVDLEHAYRVLSTDPRSRMRAPFGTYEKEGGQRKILARIERTRDGFAGLAHWSWPSQALDPPCEGSGDGSMTLSHRLLSRRMARATATHELMHLFQYAVNVFTSDWVDESTARWAEGFVFPADKRVIESWASFIHHTTSIWNASERSVAYSPHFWDFLDQVLDTSVPPKFWAWACTLEWDEALRQTLADHEVELDPMLHRYAVWNYYTGTRDDGSHYRIQPLPEIEPDALFTVYPVVDHGLGETYAEAAASNYLFFSGIATRENLRVQLHGDAAWTEHRMVSWIGTTGSNTHSAVTSVAPAATEFVIPQWHRYDQVAVIVTNGWNAGALSPAQLQYTVSAMEEGNPVLDIGWRESSAQVRVSNPSRRGASIRYRSSGTERPTRVAIYDARGRLVKQLLDRTFAAGDHGLYWDGSSETGGVAPAGSYMLILSQDGVEVSRKFILLR